MHLNERQWQGCNDWSPESRTLQLRQWRCHDPNGRQGEGHFVNRNALLEKCNETVGVAIALKYDLLDQLD